MVRGAVVHLDRDWSDYLYWESPSCPSFGEVCILQR